MKPSEAVAEGKCPSCLGTGRVNRVVPYEDEFPCSTCHGTGKWPPIEVPTFVASCGNEKHPRGAWHMATPLPFATWHRMSKAERQYRRNMKRWGCGCYA